MTIETLLRDDFGTEIDVACSLHSTPLGSDTNLLAGRESDLVNFAALTKTVGSLTINPAPPPEALFSGQVTVGTTPTGGQIEVWAWGRIDDTPTYPDQITGADSARSITSSNIKNTALKLVTVIPGGTTSNRKYPFGPYSLASLFGGQLPQVGGFWIVHNTGVALNATSTNHFLRVVPVYKRAVT